MNVYSVKRNIPLMTVFVVIILLIAVISLPIKKKTITEIQTYTVLEPISFNETQVIQVKNGTKEIKEKTDISYDWEYDGSPYRTTNDDNKYYNQDYDIILEEEYEDCIEINYSFYDDGRLVAEDDENVCFNNKKESFTLTELYVGNMDDHYFKLEIETPTILKTIVKDVYINVTEDIESVKYVNVTKEKEINKTVRTWLFG